MSQDQPIEIRTFMVSNRTVGTRTTAFVTILPQDVAEGGVLTVQRIVGHIFLYREMVRVCVVIGRDQADAEA